MFRNIRRFIYNRLKGLKDRRTCEELRQGLGIESVDRVVSRDRLRWYGHVERKNADDWVSKCRNLKVVGGIRKGRDKKTWIECVTIVMKKIGLKRRMHRIGHYGAV